MDNLKQQQQHRGADAAPIAPITQQAHPNESNTTLPQPQSTPSGLQCIKLYVTIVPRSPILEYWLQQKLTFFCCLKKNKDRFITNILKS